MFTENSESISDLGFFDIDKHPYGKGYVIKAGNKDGRKGYGEDNKVFSYCFNHSNSFDLCFHGIYKQ